VFIGFHAKEIVREYQKLGLVLMGVRRGEECQPSEQLRSNGEVGGGH